MVSVDPLIVVVFIPVVIGITAGVLMYQVATNQYIDLSKYECDKKYKWLINKNRCFFTPIFISK